MKNNKLTLVKCIAIPLILGALVGFVTQAGMDDFKALNHPPLTPPDILFPIVWTILYALMGISAYLVKTAPASEEDIAKAMSVYFYQLVVNFLWPIFFFNFQWFLFSFFWLLLLWILVIVMIKRFYRIRPIAAYMNIPYLIWLTFAAYLNLGVWWLNR